MSVRVDTRLDMLYQGVAESKLCWFSFMHRVIVLFHFSSRRQANSFSRRVSRLRQIIRLVLQIHSHVCSSDDHRISVFLPLIL